MRDSRALYLVATPIGNLGDMTLRAIETLREVDFVICEDTRRSGALLKHLQISKPLKSLHDHTPKAKQQVILEELKKGARAALISDAGTPLISDPGLPFVRDAIRAGLRVEAIPGPTAFVNALIVSGLPVHAFTFLGYLPQKDKARREALEAVGRESRTLIFYESPHRIVKTLNAMVAILGDREASVSREMTKKFEETVRGKLSEILPHFEGKKVMGELTMVVAGATESADQGGRPR